MTDERVTRYLAFTDKQKSDEGARDLFNMVVASYDSESPIFAYAVTLNDGTFVGSCGIMILPEDGVVECYYGGDTIWVFLATAMTPLGLGLLVLVASEILDRLPLGKY